MNLTITLRKIAAYCHNHPTLLFWAIVLLNIAFRLPHTDYASIYLDEGQTMFQVKRDINLIIEEYVKKQQNAPLYFILAHFWVKMVGLSVFTVRLLSVIFMAFAGGMVFLLARKSISTSFAFGVSLLFFGVNDFMNFAHEARGYALIAFLAVSSFYVLFSLLISPSKKWAMLLVVLNLSLLFTHYLTIYIVPTQFLIVVFWLIISKNKSSFWHYIISQLATGLLFLPWLGVVFSVMPEKGEFWIPEPSWAILKNNYYYLVNGKLKTHWAFGILAVSFVIWLAKSATINKKVKLAGFMFLLWAFLPVLANYFIGFYIPVFLAKYTFYASFGFLLLFSLALFQLWNNGYFKTLLFAYCAFLSFKSLNFSASKGENWKGAIDFVKTIENDSNTIFFIQRSYVYKAFYVYYDIELFRTSEKPFAEGEKDGIFFKERVEDITKLEDKFHPKRIVYLRSHWRGSDPNETVKKYFTDNYELNSSQQFEKIDVFEFIKP